MIISRALTHEGYFYQERLRQTSCWVPWCFLFLFKSWMCSFSHIKQSHVEGIVPTICKLPPREHLFKYIFCPGHRYYDEPKQGSWYFLSFCLNDFWFLINTHNTCSQLTHVEIELKFLVLWWADVSTIDNFLYCFFLKRTSDFIPKSLKKYKIFLESLFCVVLKSTNTFSDHAHLLLFKVWCIKLINYTGLVKL